MSQTNSPDQDTKRQTQCPPYQSLVVTPPDSPFNHDTTFSVRQYDCFNSPRFEDNISLTQTKRSRRASRSDPLFSAVVSLTTNAFTSSCCTHINVKYVIQITVELCNSSAARYLQTAFRYPWNRSLILQHQLNTAIFNSCVMNSICFAFIIALLF